MNTLKIFLFNRFKTLSFLTLCIVFSIVLLMVRIKLTHSLFLIFLVWNLFLAIVPYIISLYLESKQKNSKTRLLVLSGIWLLFLPNAPYIVTDLIHLRMSSGKIIWLDILVISSSAFTGIVLYFSSIQNMLKVYKDFSNKHLKMITLSSLFLATSFGVYLGRFLRYNSWEIIQNPISLTTDILLIIFFPTEHIEAWLFTILFSIFLVVTYLLHDHLRNLVNI